MDGITGAAAEQKDFVHLGEPSTFNKPSREIRSIFFPTDLSGAGDLAFCHALKIALCNKCELDIVNVLRKRTPRRNRCQFPSIRQTLEQWEALDLGSSGDAIKEELGMNVRKVRLFKPSRVDAMLRFLKREPSDLIVLASEGRAGMKRFLKPSVAERLARRAKTATLLLPRNGRGFVSVRDGSVRLDRVLMACVGLPNAQPAMDALSHLLFSICTKAPQLITFHVENAGDTPSVVAPPQLADSVERDVERGETAEDIVSLAEKHSADLIVMASDAPKGIKDVLKGTITEQVVRQALCPVLSVPINQSRVIKIRY